MHLDKYSHIDRILPAVLEKLSIGMALLSEGLLIYKNSAFEKMFALTEAVCSEDYDKFPVKSASEVLNSIITSKAANHVRYLQLRSKDGRVKNVSVRKFLPAPGVVLLVCEEFSPGMRTFEEHATEKKYLHLLENLTDFVYALDLDGTILSLNAGAARSLGYEPEDLINKPIDNIIPAALRYQIRGNLQRVASQGFAEGISQYLAKDGSIHYLEYRSVSICADGLSPNIVGVARDVTERIRATRRLKENQTKFQIIVETAHDGITYVDKEGRIIFSNPRMKEILKDPDPEGKLLTEYYDEENKQILISHLMMRSKGRSSTYFATITDLEGVRHKMVVSGTPYVNEKGVYEGAVGIFTDISDLRRLEEQLQHAQKMEAIGTLAGGIAHDFNNILSGVLGYASLLKKNTDPGTTLNHYAEMIERSAERGALLAGQLLAFSRKGKRFGHDVDVHKLMDEIVEILRRTLDRKIVVICRKKSTSSVIEGEAAQIEQILMNLCLNARDAMPDGGRLILETETVKLDSVYCQGPEGVEPGDFLEIRVRDDGHGIPESVRTRIFEPFFTTKGEGKGTGLGLSMVYGTVQSHGGLVEVDSDIGKGSVFKVMLPLKKNNLQVLESVIETETEMGSGTVLVVDDEEIIRNLLAEMLKELGFNVVTAQDGLEALDIYRSMWKTIDVVVLDMIMPRLNGRESFLEMKKINPSIRAVLSTGYTKDQAIKDTLDQGIVGFMPKPYRINELARLISEAIDDTHHLRFT